MSTIDPTPRAGSGSTAGSGTVGYVVVLVGAVTFVVSCFLPYFEEVPGPLSRTASLYRLSVLRPGTSVEHVGAFFYLFAGAATIAWISIAGASGHRSWTHVALAAVSVAWSLTWIGTLVYESTFLSPHKAGYWVLLLGVGVVVGGTIVVWASRRAASREPSATAA